jgi:hypothetical protein
MPGAADRRESEVPGLGHVTDQPGLVKNHDARAGAELTGVEFQLDGMEYNEYRGGTCPRGNRAMCFSSISG